MTTKKLQIAAGILIGSLVMTMSCDESSNLTAVKSNTNAGTLVANYTFNGTEGDPITLDVANRWIVNYTTRNSGNPTAYFIGQQRIEDMLTKNGSIGIRFYYSIDNSGNPVLFATPADSKGRDFSCESWIKGVNSSFALNTEAARGSFTGTEGESVAMETSKQWISNYNSAQPNGIRAHFFGYQIIRQILSTSDCVGLRCYYALNDAGVQQLLLIGVSSSGRNMLPLSGARIEDSNLIADASFPCPSHCSP